MKTTFALALLFSCLTGLLMVSAAKNPFPILEACMSENGVTLQDFEDIKSGKMQPENAKDNIKCATQCMFVKLGFMNDKGQLNNEKILEFVPNAPLKAKMQDALAACGNTVGANPCDTAFQILVCLDKQAGDMLNL
ncbi:uncharacterized protein LOC117785000 [Drosophila innubila]|uniref:uncharacterized protein LOC117785000 n=1 Tax=Drosophila innubila TaxID=198719 RepID=UPI00148DB3AC|nr:uncharacterized protein LOC117785000 [Drosophila innubila]